MQCDRVDHAERCGEQGHGDPSPRHGGRSTPESNLRAEQRVEEGLESELRIVKCEWLSIPIRVLLSAIKPIANQLTWSIPGTKYLNSRRWAGTRVTAKEATKPATQSQLPPFSPAGVVNLPLPSTK
jgi:hypothetical protein